MISASERARFRFVFEPFVFFSLLALADEAAAWILARRQPSRPRIGPAADLART